MRRIDKHTQNKKSIDKRTGYRTKSRTKVITRRSTKIAQEKTINEKIRQK